jgi:hypothetical protein
MVVRVGGARRLVTVYWPPRADPMQTIRTFCCTFVKERKGWNDKSELNPANAYPVDTGSRSLAAEFHRKCTMRRRERDKHNPALS